MGGSSIILLLFFTAPFFIPGTMSATFVFTNKCHEPIYPAVLANSGKPAFPTTGFELQPGASATFAVPSGRFSCASGDCGSGRVECGGAGGQAPSTLAEFTLGDQNGRDFYDVSNVDGFNLPLQVAPAGCAAAACGADINAACPGELAAKAADGSTVGCRSACLAFNTDELCCRGAFGNPATCRPSGYAMFFKQSCPQAYSYAYDDRSSTFTCNTGADYNIVFCP
ncbi:hypothetical protein ACP70R_007880 [Stipagrostis hirtigluma subsp. patula]